MHATKIIDIDIVHLKRETFVVDLERKLWKQEKYLPKKDLICRKCD